MGITILRRKSYYALGLVLVIIGIVMLLIVFWRWWTSNIFSETNIIQAILDSFGVSDELLNLGLGLSLFPYLIFGIVFIIIGSIILVLRREKVTVIEEVTTILKCPICKHQWQEPMSKAHLKSIGYPKVRTLARHKCPKCAKFIRPKIVRTKK